MKLYNDRKGKSIAFAGMLLDMHKVADIIGREYH